MRLKLFLVTVLLAISLLALIISLDLIMGVRFRGVIWKALNPFQVMETAEYIIILLFILGFLIGTIGSYLKKKKGDKPTAN
jgi:hypothetical protein